MNGKPALPIDAVLPSLISSLLSHPNLVIEAAPGAGKTTRVPPALLGIVTGEVVVLEPRRIAARLAARRVAAELGEEVGETVGYQVRFEEVSGPQTRLRFVTEGVLTRRLLSDPSLQGVGAVVLDEFHERHMETDLALALLKRLQQKRPDLRILVMSATLDAGPVAHYLGDCPMLRSEGKIFDVFVRHLPYSPLPLHTQVRNAIELLTAEERTGHILIFLPGTAEIRRAMRECESVAHRAGFQMLPLHGNLSPAEQDRVLSPTRSRKLIFATNVAESSVTIDGVTAVIDSGLARIATYSPWIGLPTLSIARVSQASAQQRAGRAGRTGPGRVLRLYPEEDFRLRPEYDLPEIVRSDLSQTCLALRAMGISDHQQVPWLTVPPQAAVQSAELLLTRLGATGEMAQQLARYPLPPRLSRMLVESVQRRVGESGCLVAALLGSGARSTQSDLLAAIEAEQDDRSLQVAKQLRRLVKAGQQVREDDDALLMSVLMGYPDRVARRRSGNQLLLSSGASAELADDTPRYEFMVAIDAEDRKEKALPIVRMTARIEPEWLLDLFPDSIRERVTVIWNQTAERVDAVSALIYDELVIYESRDTAPNPEAATELLVQKAIEAGLERFVEGDALDEFRARLAFGGFELPDVPKVLHSLGAGLRSFTELRSSARRLIPMLQEAVGATKLDESAPVNVKLRSGRLIKVHYEEGKPPWIASRLQDFFGMQDSPEIGPNRTPLVIHLLAPNQRAVQTTSDLRGFWERLYPQVRRDLMRRYPRHSWPERP